MAQLLKRLLIATILLWASACAGAPPFPASKLYIPDLANQVCTEYQIDDLDELTYHRTVELELKAKGPCDRIAGFARCDFKAVQNWIRDEIRRNK